MSKVESVAMVDREQFIKTLYQLLLDYATQLQGELQSLLYVNDKRENNNVANVSNNNNKNMNMEVEVERPEEVYQEELNDMQSQLRRIRTVMSIVQKAQREQLQWQPLNKYYHHHYLSFCNNKNIADNLTIKNNIGVEKANTNHNMKDDSNIKTNSNAKQSYKELSDLSNTIYDATSSSLAYVIILNTLRCVRLQMIKDEPICTSTRKCAPLLSHIHDKRSRESSVHQQIHLMSKNVSLPEVMLDIYGRNTCVHLRRRKRSEYPQIFKKEKVEKIATTEAASDVELPFFARLASIQCSQRDDIYTARTPQFPVMYLEENKATNHSSNSILPNVYISPALRQFTSLNMEAEGKMAMHMCKVKTKLQLLLDIPKLKDEVAHYRSDLQAQDLCADRLQSIHNFVLSHSNTIRPCMTEKSKILHRNNNEELIQSDLCAPRSLHYFTFPCTNDGVVRAIVQQALVLDLTYDFNAKQWCLLQMQWDLYTTPFAGLNTDRDNLTYEVEQTHNESELQNNNECQHDNSTLNANNYNECSQESQTSCSSITPSKWNKIIVPHKNVMFRYLHHHFANDGLASGCMAANRLVNTVVMDAVATQLTELQKSFFVGPLSSLFSLDIRTGTFVAWRLTLPSHTNLHHMHHKNNNTSTTQQEQQQENENVKDSEHTKNSGTNAKLQEKSNVESVVMHFKAYIACGMVLCDVIANTNVMNKQTFRVLSPFSTNNAKIESGTKTALNDNYTNTRMHGSVIDVVELVFNYLYENTLIMSQKILSNQLNLICPIDFTLIYEFNFTDK